MGLRMRWTDGRGQWSLDWGKDWGAIFSVTANDKLSNLKKYVLRAQKDQSLGEQDKMTYTLLFVHDDAEQLLSHWDSF